MINIAKHLSDIITEAVQSQIPEIKEKFVINSEKDKEWQYATPSAIKIFNMFKKKGGLGCANCMELAQKISECIPTDGLIEKVELCKAGKGPDEKSGFFINIFIRMEFLALKLKDLAIGEISYHAETQQKVAVDFSSPNIAKNMHVGHLRSTIIGESLCRILEFMGHDVQRINHIGDWGTQFGMLISHMQDTYPDFLENRPDISDLDGFYKEAKKRFDEEEDFKTRSREAVVRLQSGSEDELKAWKMICDVSRAQFEQIYKRLDVTNNEFGESFYNDMIPPLVKRLEDEGIITEDQGCKCIFVPKIKTPMIIVKSDGGYNYDSTDLAAMNYRANELKCDRIIVLTDMGQGFHFKQLEGACKMSGILDPKKHRFDHMGFGLVLDENGEKIKSRSGETVQLMSLLDEAQKRAVDVCKEKHVNFDEEQKLTEEEYEKMGEIIGITSVKYFDLKQNRTSTYKFGFDAILDPKGDTGVYLLYMYVRLCSILRKGGYDQEKIAEIAAETEIQLETEEEKTLAMLLLRLPEYVDNVFNDLQINKICNMLYDISSKIGEFYARNKVLGDEKEKSRILLIELTRKTMKTLFDLLGMKTIEKI
jgi:arginyl-tRNA synthetase